MSLNWNEPVYKRCGHVGVTTAEYPRCKFYIYYKSKGHFKTQYPDLLCRNYNEQGHRTLKYPHGAVNVNIVTVTNTYRPSRRPRQVEMSPWGFPVRDSISMDQAGLRFKSPRHDDEEWHALERDSIFMDQAGLRFESPRHNDEEWHALERDVREAVMLQENITGVNLSDLCADLLKGIMESAVRGSENNNYKEYIINQGDIDEATQDIVRHINPLVQSLKGQKIT